MMLEGSVQTGPRPNEIFGGLDLNQMVSTFGMDVRHIWQMFDSLYNCLESLHRKNGEIPYTHLPLEFSIHASHLTFGRRVILRNHAIHVATHQEEWYNRSGIPEPRIIGRNQNPMPSIILRGANDLDYVVMPLDNDGQIISFHIPFSVTPPTSRLRAGAFLNVVDQRLVAEEARREVSYRRRSTYADFDTASFEGTLPQLMAQQHRQRA